MNKNNSLIDLETARALVARGWSVVPTESDAEKRPKAKFATAKSWRDFSDRPPTDAELLGWFGTGPRRGGVVLHRGQLCRDRDTKDALPDGSAPWEETDHGSHEFFQCDPDANPKGQAPRRTSFLPRLRIVSARYPPRGITVRASTDFIAAASPIVRKSLEYIRLHIGETFGLTQV